LRVFLRGWPADCPVSSSARVNALAAGLAESGEASAPQKSDPVGAGSRETNPIGVRRRLAGVLGRLPQVSQAIAAVLKEI
jgi:hypothetical protein